MASTSWRHRSGKRGHSILYGVYAPWIDHPLPALRGQTPREAVRTKAGRERVDVLLKELENHESGLAEGARFDLGAALLERPQFRVIASP